MVVGTALSVETEGLRRREAFCFVRFGLNSQSVIKQIVFCLRTDELCRWVLEVHSNQTNSESRTRLQD
jgi:hypothetical protein